MDTAELQSKLQQSLFQGIPKNYSKDASLGKKKKKSNIQKEQGRQRDGKLKRIFFAFCHPKSIRKKLIRKRKTKNTTKQTSRKRTGGTNQQEKKWRDV